MALEKKRSSENATSTDSGSGRPRFVVCINNAEHPASLELHKIYRVLPDDDAAQDGDVRVIDESGESYLYPKEWFVPLEVPHAIERSLLHR